MTSGPPQSYLVDTSVLVAYFMDSDIHHAKVLPYWDELEKAQCRFHIPMLAVVETAGALYRRSSLIDAVEAVYRLRQLAEQGSIVQYPLDEMRKRRAVSAALQYHLRGADAVYAALADELQLELLTADNDFSNYPKLINLA